MLGRLWRRLRDAVRGDGGEDRGRFVPSPLDLSVRIAHGGRDDEVDRELARVHRQAEELEDAESR